jgi:hypothetical protein
MLTMRPALALDHARQHRVMHVQRAGQVDRNQLVPLRRLGLGEGLEHIPAGVVDQHVDGAELRLGRNDGRVHAGTVGDVAMEGLGDTTHGADSGSDLLRIHDGEVENGDEGSFTTEPATRRPADPATAGDHHCPASKRCIMLPIHCQDYGFESMYDPSL